VAEFDERTSTMKSALKSRSQDDALLRVVCRSLVVGRATTTSSSPVAVFHDRLEYKFHHQKQGQVVMLMWYRDIDSARLNEGSLVFTFHVARPLTQHFAGEYDPGCATDWLALQFCSREDAARFGQACPLLADRGSWPNLK